MLMTPDHCYVVAEIGINHNGDLNIARQLIDAAKSCGCDAVKFQKRTIEKVYTRDQLSAPRKSPFGTTNGELKRALEFGKPEYDQIDLWCREKNINWYASPWDLKSVDFLVEYDVPFLKIASPLVTDRSFLEKCAQTGKPLIVSTGMCDLAMIRKSVAAIFSYGGKIACLYHCTSTYPTAYEELNLKAISTLQKEFPDIPIGYSGHELGVAPTVMAAVLGATSVERHITLDRSMWGSDQAASVEIPELDRMVKDIRLWEAVRGDGLIRYYNSEKETAQKLRTQNTL
jgi:N-acetylneuraminate synthase